MASESVLILCQYNGILDVDSRGRPNYIGGDRKMFRISKRSKFANLKKKVYTETRINPDEYDIKMVCCCPMTSQDYLSVQVADDEDTKLMLSLYPQVPSVNLLIVQEPIMRNESCLAPPQGGFSNMLDMDNDSTGFLSPHASEYGMPSMPINPPVYESYATDWNANLSSSYPYTQEHHIANPSTSPDMSLSPYCAPPISTAAGLSNVHTESESEDSDNELDTSMRENSIQCAIDNDDPQWVHASYANNEWVHFEDPLPDEVIEEDMVRDYAIERVNFDVNMDMSVDEQFVVGQMFSTKNDLIQAISDWSIRRCVAFRTLKSTTTKYTVVCANTKASSSSSSSQQCLWRLHAIVPTKLMDSHKFMIKKYIPHHTCQNMGREMENRQVSAKFICQLILRVLKTSLDMTPRNIQDHVKIAYHRNISYYKAWDGRRKALSKLFGDWETSYHSLSQYMDAIARSNPGAVYKIAYEQVNEDCAIFDGLFWSFGPSIEGFSQCRPVLSIDGTHLTGKYRGLLLIAIGVDADGGLYPLAYAVVRAETTENWEWFFTCIRKFIPSVRRRQITWISDRMKGLPRALAQGWKEPHFHRYCLRHIRANFKLKFRDEALQNLLYSAGRTSDPLVYTEYRNKIREKSPAADAWIDSSLGPDNGDRWALCKDGGRRYCIMTTNCSDSFNGVLKGARALPIQSIVARTFYRINTYFVTRREASTQWVGQFTSSTEKILGDRVNESRHCTMTRFSWNTWEVFDKKALKYDIYIDDDHCECSCNIPMLQKIPCIHVIKACSRLDGSANRDIERYCSQWYSTNNYQQSYAPTLRHVPDNRYWIPRQPPLLLPPVEKRSKGRPRTARIKGAMDDQGHEGQAGRNKCSKCHEYGHKRSTCKKHSVMTYQSIPVFC